MLTVARDEDRKPSYAARIETLGEWKLEGGKAVAWGLYGTAR
jgi:hypothetical protein